MKNYRIIIAYDGSRYNGWQKQNDTANTIQQIINDALIEFSGEKVKLIGSGRTDAGVHALAQNANFRCNTVIDTDKLPQAVNRLLPEDIRIIKACETDYNFHARYSVTGKRYVYRLDTGDVRNPFERKYAWRQEKKLNLDAMRKSAQYMTGEHDFRGFCTDAGKMPYTVKTINAITFTDGYSSLTDSKSDGIIEIEFYGKGFLYNMVRILAGTLVDAGLGIYRPEDIAEFVKGCDRSMTGQLAPARGLVLKEVEYM